MPYFVMTEVVHYYDGPQIILMDYEGVIKKPTPQLLVAQSCDDGIFFGSRITRRTLNDLRSRKIDIRNAMIKPYNNECYVILEDHFLPPTQSIKHFVAMFGFRVDGIHQSYIDWAVPDQGLFFDI